MVSPASIGSDAAAGVPTIDTARHRRAALVSGAWGFGLLKLGLDGIVLALIPLATAGVLLMVGALFNDGLVAMDSETQDLLAPYAVPAFGVLAPSIVVAVIGVAVGQRILRSSGVPSRAAVGWSTVGILTLPWIAVWALLAFATLGVASTQNYSGGDWYWGMWPIFVVAVLVDTAFGAVTGALVTLWMSRTFAARAARTARLLY